MVTQLKIIAKAKNFSSLAVTTTLLPLPPTFLESLESVLLGFRVLCLRECYLCIGRGEYFLVLPPDLFLLPRKLTLLIRVLLC